MVGFRETLARFSGIYRAKMKKLSKFKGLYLNPIFMGLNLMLVALGVPRLQAGAKTLHNEVIDVIPGLNNPLGVAVSADSKYVYVANDLNNTLVVIDADTHQIIDNAIYAGADPYSVGTQYRTGRKSKRKDPICGKSDNQSDLGFRHCRPRIIRDKYQRWEFTL
jgi:YVTN family beta-propeller protein